MAALCVGLNYPTKSYRLSSCDKDAEYWSNFIAHTGISRDMIHYRISLDLDKLKEILNGLLFTLGAGTTLWFTFSGHGSSMKDNNGDERDGRDEAILLDNEYLLRDDDLMELFKPLSDKGVSIIMILDHCHSGTMADLKYYYQEGEVKLYTNQDRCTEYNGLVLAISACQDEELAGETTKGGKLTLGLRAMLDTDADTSLANIIPRLSVTGQKMRYNMSRPLDLGKTYLGKGVLVVAPNVTTSTSAPLKISRDTQKKACCVM